MPELIDISDWTPQPYYSTKGTRNKSLVLDPDGIQYYFKTSLFKPDRDYRYEFWSEIIAFEIGQMIGLDVLKYDIAINGNQIGCLSKSMVSKPNEILTEGVQYLQGYDANFAPGQQKGGASYTWELISSSLNKFELQKYLLELIDVVFFDCIIGNGDRHQENWGFIVEHTYVSKRFAVVVREIKKFVQNNELWKSAPKWLKFLIRKGYLKGTSQQLRDEVLFANFTWNKNIRLAPIYDNGSSLGRELTEERVTKLLESGADFEKYINNGLAEIHWKNEKLDHFGLMSRLIESHPEKKTRLIGMASKFNAQAFKDILAGIDAEVPEEFVGFRLSDRRKELIFRLVEERVKRLQALLNG